MYKEKATFQTGTRISTLCIDERFKAGTYFVKANIDGKAYIEKLVIKE